jgi:hypothetical protein
MPTTVNIVDHVATPWKQSNIVSPEKLLESACPKQWRRCEKVVQSSFEISELSEAHISASDNGFIRAAYTAYNYHHHLVLRPEDVWFAILTQLSFYINAHAEELRSFFVQHDGQKELEAVSDIADFGALAVQMTDLISKNVNDPELRGWVMPSFTTTQHHDKVVGAVLFMGAMQAYFSFKMRSLCGLPSVTLLGEVADWQDILQRLDKIDQLGEEPKQFADMLRPILQHFVLTFEDSTSAKVTHFWNTIVHRNEVGSGTDYLSGWLTAFCFWSEEGKAKRICTKLFEDVDFPYVDVDSIPVGFASVPVKVDDNGHKYDATMVAGSVGIAASGSNSFVAASSLLQGQGQQEVSSNDATASNGSTTPVRDTVQPRSGWWIVENEAKEVIEARETEKKRLSDEIAMYDEERKNTDFNAFYKSESWKKRMEAYRRHEDLLAF